MVVISLDTVSRIFSLLQERRIEQKKFAVLLGTTDKTVSAWRTGRSKSYTKYIPQIAEILNTTTEYLLTGEKPKHTAKAVPDSDTVSEEAHLVALAYDQADEKSRAMVRLALNLDAAEPTSSPASDKAM